MALTFIGTGCGQGVLYCPPSPQETTHWNNGGLPIGEQRATIRAWAKICPLPFFNCHFFTLKEVLSLRRSLSECSLISNQNKTKQKTFPFLSASTKLSPHCSLLYFKEENKVSQYSAFSIKTNERSVRWACGLAWSHGAKGRFSFAWFSCTPLLYSWSTQGKWKDGPPPPT